MTVHSRFSKMELVQLFPSRTLNLPPIGDSKMRWIFVGSYVLRSPRQNFVLPKINTHSRSSEDVKATGSKIDFHNKICEEKLKTIKYRETASSFSPCLIFGPSDSRKMETWMYLLVLFCTKTIQHRKLKCFWTIFIGLCMDVLLGLVRQL